MNGLVLCTMNDFVNVWLGFSRMLCGFLIYRMEFVDLL